MFDAGDLVETPERGRGRVSQEDVEHKETGFTTHLTEGAERVFETIANLLQLIIGVG